MGPMAVKDWDVRLGKQFDEHANREKLTCGPACALEYVQSHGGDVSKAYDTAPRISYVPHVGGEAGFGHVVHEIHPRELETLRKNGARCTHCAKPL